MDAMTILAKQLAKLVFCTSTKLSPHCVHSQHIYFFKWSVQTTAAPKIDSITSDGELGCVQQNLNIWFKLILLSSRQQFRWQ